MTRTVQQARRWVAIFRIRPCQAYAASLLALSSGLWAGPSAAQQAGEAPVVLNEAEAVQRALSRPALTGTWGAQVAAAKAQAKSAGAWPNPTANYIREQSFTQPQSQGEDFALVQQQLPISGRRGLLAQAAQQRAKAQALQNEAARLALAARVRRAFYRVLALQQRVEVREQALKRVQAVAEDFAQRVEAGESPAYQLERVRQDVAEIRAALDVDAAALARQRIRLAQQVGVTPLQRTLRVDGVLVPQTLPDADALERAIRQRPELEAAEQRIEAARLQRRAAARAWLPEPQVTAGFKGAQIGSQYFSGFTAGVNFPVPVLNQRVGRRLQAQAQLSQALYRRERIERRLRAQLLGAATEARRLKATVERYRKEAIDRSERVFATVLRAHQGGELDILEVVEASRGVMHARLQGVQLASQARASEIALQRRLQRLPRISG